MQHQLSLINRLKLKINGYVLMGNKKRAYWVEPIPFYLFYCPEHGLVEDYLHGYTKRLECPICRNIVKEKHQITDIEVYDHLLEPAYQIIE